MRIGFFDTETTGLHPDKGDKVIELCLIPYDSGEAGWTKGETYLQRFNPERSIAAAAQAVHKITFEMVAGEPVFRECAAQIYRLFSECDLAVAHNLPFDVGFLIAEFDQAGMSMPKVAGFDTCDSRWATPYGKVPKLGELCFALGIEYDENKAHSAEYDVEVMAAAFFKGVQLGFFKLPVGGVSADQIQSVRPDGKNFAGSVE